MIFGADIALTASLTALLLALLSVVWLVFLSARLKKLFRGRGAQDLRGVLSEIQENLEHLSEREKQIDEFLAGVEARLKRSAQNVGVVRFNPYDGVGGEQSFSVAVLDERRNGFVITGLYGREQSRVYAKPVAAGESQYQLSGEEREAIEKAVRKV